MGEKVSGYIPALPASLLSIPKPSTKRESQGSEGPGDVISALLAGVPGCSAVCWPQSYGGPHWIWPFDSFCIFLQNYCKRRCQNVIFSSYIKSDTKSL